MIPLAKKIWLDGKFVEWNKANVHVLTHGLHYGSSVFEGIRCYKTDKGGAIFRLDDHIERFFYSAQCLGMRIPFSKSVITKAILDIVRINKAKECYIRPIAFYGYGKMGLSPAGAPTQLAIASWQWNIKRVDERGVSVKISPFIRLHPRSVAIKAKLGGYYVNSIFASNDAKKNGFQEALLLDYKGYVAEGSGNNLFMVKNKIIYTPSPDNILSGITRDSIMKIARDFGIKVIEKKIKPSELKKADEVFLVGTAVEVWPVLKIDTARINNGRVGGTTGKLINEYQKIIHGENRKYHKWLTFVK